MALRVIRALLRTFCDTMVTSTVCYAIVCWKSGITDRDRRKLDTLVRRALSVPGCPLDSIKEVADS